MQISALEVSKVTTGSGTRAAKPGKPHIGFVPITADSLPKTVAPEAADIQRAVNAVDAAPDVREEVVMRLKAAIDSGEYKVSGDEIAEMMVRRMKADRIR